MSANHRILFGETLRAKRLEAGLSQAELAQRAGIVQSAISSFEHGTTQPTLDTITRLAVGLGVTPATLLGEVAA